MKRIKISTDVKVIKNKDINTLEFRLIYPIKSNHDNNYYIDLLDLFFNSSNHDIRNFKEFQTARKRNTVLNITFKDITIVDNTYLVYSFTLPKENLIKDYSLEESFQFAIKSLLNPACDNKEFDLDKFNYEKNYLYEQYKKMHEGIYASTSNKFYEVVDPEHEIANSYERDGEVLLGITNKSLYDFYEKNILKGAFIPYVYGDITEKKAKSLFSKYLPQEKKELSFTANYFKALKMSNPSYNEEITRYNQSVLYLEYQAEIEEKEIKYFSTIVNLLNAPENNLIFDALRVKNNLVYDVNIRSFSSRALFVIIAFIPNDKYKETKEIIKEVFKSLEDKEYLSSCLAKLVKGLEVDLLKQMDNPGKVLNDRVNSDLKISTLEDLEREVKKIKADDLIKFMKKIKLTNEFFFRGSGND